MADGKPGRPKHLPKTGGRKKGTPNRAKIEAAERARIEAENAKNAIEIAKASHHGGPSAIVGIQRKLAKDLIEEYMMVFHGQAARHQPLPPGMDPEDARRRGFVPDEEKFKEYAVLAVTTARALAEFQSPKLRAHLVTMPGGEGGAGLKMIDEDGNNVIPKDDAVRASQVYSRIMKTVVG